jgi:hypothetical protein
LLPPYSPFYATNIYRLALPYLHGLVAAVFLLIVLGIIRLIRGSRILGLSELWCGLVMGTVLGIQRGILAFVVSVAIALVVLFVQAGKTKRIRLYRPMIAATWLIMLGGDWIARLLSSWIPYL